MSKCHPTGSMYGVLRPHPIGSEKTRIVAHSEPEYRDRTIRLIEPRSFFGVKTTRLIARAEKLGLKRHA